MFRGKPKDFKYSYVLLKQCGQIYYETASVERLWYLFTHVVQKNTSMIFGYLLFFATWFLSGVSPGNVSTLSCSFRIMSLQSNNFKLRLTISTVNVHTVYGTVFPFPPHPTPPHSPPFHTFVSPSPLISNRLHIINIFAAKFLFF